MNPKAVFAVLAVAIGCSSFAVAQRPAKMNLGEGEAKARKILLEKAAKEGKVSDAAAPAAGTVTHWGGVISWGRSQLCVQHGGTQSGEGFVDIPRAYLCEMVASPTWGRTSTRAVTPPHQPRSPGTK